MTVICSLLLTSCFKSVETPIKGTKNLVTYTTKEGKTVGIKFAGVNELLTPAIYVKVECKNGYLLAQRQRTSPAASVTWDLLDAKTAKSITGSSYESISSAPNYFVMHNDKGKYYLKNGTSQAIGPKADIFIKKNLVLTKSGDKWGVNGVFGEKYEQIIVLYQNGGQPENYRFVVKNGKQYSLLGSDGKVIKKTVSAQAVKRLEQLAKNYKDQNWTYNTSLSGRTVANIKTAI